MLTTSVLMLNRSFFPVHITTVKRALCMLYGGLVKAVDSQYQTFTFDNWAELAAAEHHETVGLIDRIMRVPRVVVLTTYDRIPKRGIRFSRLNIMTRDRYQCQYCGRRLPTQELNLDHVIPRSRGGLTTWRNVATSCHTCNRRKGGRTPEEAHMRLIRKPFRPTSLPFLHLNFKTFRYEEWKPYLSVVDYSYWNVELKP